MYPKDYFSDPVNTMVPGSCFVLMPFSKEMRPVYDAIIEALEHSEVAFTCQRADELFGGGHIIRDVLRGIASAELVIADVTSRNPNVFYELGIAHTTKSIERVLIVTQSMDDVPFDLRQFRCFDYDPAEEGLQRLKKVVTEAVRAVSPNIFRFFIGEAVPYEFSQKLQGEGNYLYNFGIVSHFGHDSAEFRLDLRRHGATQQNVSIGAKDFGMQVGESVAIPHLPWNLHLDRIIAGRAYFSVRRAPNSATAPFPTPAPTPTTRRLQRDPAASADEAGVVKSASLAGYVVRELESGTIQVLKEGVPVLPAKPALREIAKSLGISLLNRQGNRTLTTRQLGGQILKHVRE